MLGHDESPGLLYQQHLLQEHCTLFIFVLENIEHLVGLWGL